MLYEENDCHFPNHHPDPNVEANLSSLKQEVLKNKADCGIAFDGDGDRIGIIDEKGNSLELVNKVQQKVYLACPHTLHTGDILRRI